MEYQAVQINAFNAAAPIEGAVLVTKTLSDPAPGEVQVKLLLAGVNPSGGAGVVLSIVSIRWRFKIQV
jgi:NADPH:quinone reductase-like Zn-dependent oxidoreductase